MRKSLILLALTAAIVTAMPVVHADTPAAASRQTLVTFGPDFDMARTQGNGGKATLSDRGTLVIKTSANSFWPGVTIKPAAGPWDLSPYQYVSIDIHNLDNHEIDVFVKLSNPGSNGTDKSVTTRTGVAPDQRVTLNVPLKRVSNSPIKLFGMAGYPQGLYPSKDALDVSQVESITVFTSANTPTDNVLEVSNIYAGGQYVVPPWGTMSEKEFFPFIDKYGQFKHSEWPGKIHSDAELKKAREAEAAKLAGDAGPTQWDKWGGWATGPTLKATGHFRVEKYQNKWWFVDPDGKLFFSTGITGVGPALAATVVEDRPNWFDDLPPNEGENARFYSKSYKVWSGHYNGKEPLMFDFGSRNLMNKYGSSYKQDYLAVIHQRLRAWGINTIANWSNGELCKMDKTPYTRCFFYGGKRITWNNGGFPDVWDPEFSKHVTAGAKQFLAGSTDDPWCLGYFVDNEMPWGGETTLAQTTLKNKADQPAKQEMVRWLKERYPNIAALNQAWNTKFASWEAFAEDIKAKPTSAAATKDLREFTERTAEMYFKTMHDVIKAVAPNKLYLGCRCVGGSTNVIATAIKYCDVVSYNRYCHSVREVRFPENLDGPMLIGEFHFGALDRGQFATGLVSADNQEQRAKCYADYVRSALENPQMIGVHWFQYGDSPTAGRGDGENYQCGFVDVCDTPYVETVQAARAVAETMYSHRLDAK